MRLLKSGPIFNFANGMLVDLAAPANINFGWNFGSLLGTFLVIQIITGFLLAGRYTAADALAFSSVDNIMREVSMGWAFRYAHAIGAGFFLSLAYIHMARGLFYASYKEPRGALWLSGLALFFLLMGTAFLGYVLVWSSMSFWAAVVITNLVSSIPEVGVQIVEWIWAGFSVGHPTLVRFYSLHFLLPFLIAALTIVHLIFLHETGSSNPIGVAAAGNFIRFNPYFILKDLLGILIVGLPYIFFIFYEPDMLNHADAFVAADPLVTPSSIVPEFYFLPFYAMLRSVPNKLGGVIVMISGILILGTLPVTSTSLLKSAKFKPLTGGLFWVLVASFLLLGWLGQKPAEDPYVILAQIASLIYFSYFAGVLSLAEGYDQSKILKKGASLI